MFYKCILNFFRSNLSKGEVVVSFLTIVSYAYLFVASSDVAMGGGNCPPTFSNIGKTCNPPFQDKRCKSGSLLLFEISHF